MVRNYIKNLQKEEKYGQIRSFVEYCKAERKEFLQDEFYKNKNFIWLAFCITTIIVVGFFSVLENTNILIKSIYCIPHILIFLIAIKTYWEARKKKFNEYKSLKKYSVWNTLYIITVPISGIPIMIGVQFSIGIEEAITLLIVLITIISLLSLIFYNIVQKLLLKQFTRVKIDQSKKINSLVGISGAFIGLTVLLTRNHLSEMFLLVGLIGVSIIALGLAIYVYCEYSLISFIESDESLISNLYKNKKK